MGELYLKSDAERAYERRNSKNELNGARFSYHQRIAGVPKTSSSHFTGFITMKENKFLF